MLAFHTFNCVILQKIIMIGMKFIKAFAALCLQNLHIPTDMYLHIWGSEIQTHN